jgi:uncharacterized membrane protein
MNANTKVIDGPRVNGTLHGRRRRIHIPFSALLVGVVLALCSIAVLIFFIHHVPSKLHINSVIEDVGAKLLREIDNRFPRCIGAPRPDDDGQTDAERVPPTFRIDASRADGAERQLIEAQATGYL